MLTLHPIAYVVAAGIFGATIACSMLGASADCNTLLLSGGIATLLVIAMDIVFWFCWKAILAYTKKTARPKTPDASAGE